MRVEKVGGGTGANLSFKEWKGMIGNPIEWRTTSQGKPGREIGTFPFPSERGIKRQEEERKSETIYWRKKNSEESIPSLSFALIREGDVTKSS